MARKKQPPAVDWAPMGRPVHPAPEPPKSKGGRPKSLTGPMPRYGVKLPHDLMGLLDAAVQSTGMDRTAITRLALIHYLPILAQSGKTS
jgi:hypothetical protein